VTSKDALLKEWAPIAKDEAKWEVVVTSFFVKCRKKKTG